MWSIVVILSGLLTGPEAYSVAEAGIFKTEESCKTAIGAAVETELDSQAKTQYDDGYRRFVCVRLLGTEALENIR
ncbi:MAG: hypothetical protein RLO15_10650 [Parvibaculum sp.]